MAFSKKHVNYTVYSIKVLPLSIHILTYKHVVQFKLVFEL